MKVHIISDIEGVAGIVKWELTSGYSPLYQEGRRLYTEEINAAVRGAKQAGATEIVVMDCHGAGGPFKFNSLVAEDLDPACEFVIQERGRATRPFSSKAATPRSSSGCTRAPARPSASSTTPSPAASGAR
jgi:D-aminopeptidase